MSLRQRLRQSMVAPLQASLAESALTQAVGENEKLKLRTSATSMESSLRALPTTDPRYARQALLASWIQLRLLHLRTGTGDLTVAQHWADRAMSSAPNQLLRASAFVLAARVAALRAQATPHDAQLARAEALFDRAIDESDAVDPASASRLAGDLAAVGFSHDDNLVDCAVELAGANFARAINGGGREHIGRVIQIIGRLIDAGAAGPDALTALAQALPYRDQPGDVEQAIEALRTAIAATGEGDPNRAARLTLLGDALWHRFRRGGHLGDLEKAVSHLGDAVAATAETAPERPGRESLLGSLLVARFEELSATADLDHGLTTLRRAADTAPEPARPVMLAALGGGLLIAADHERSAPLLAAAIEALVTAVPALVHNSRGRALDDLVLAGIADATGRGDLDRADDCLGLARRQSAATPPEHADYRIRQLHLGLARLCRFRLSGEVPDVDAAIALLDSVPQLPDSPVGIEHIRASTILHQLGRARLERFHVTGRIHDLDAAVSTLRTVVAQCRPTHRRWPAASATLASALHTRYTLLGAVADLDAAVAAYQSALEDGSLRGEAAHYTGLSRALSDRHLARGDLADAEAAVDAAWSGVAATPAAHPDRVPALAQFGNALRQRHQLAGDPADLVEAITAYQWAVAAVPLTHPRAPVLIAGLVDCLVQPVVDRHADTGAAPSTDLPASQREAYLRQAREHIARALVGVATGHPDRGLLEFRRAELLGRQSAGAPDTSDTADAYEAFLRVATDTLSPPSLRMRAATSAATLAAQLGHVPMAAEAYAVAVELLALLAWRGLDRGDQERWLRQASGVTAEAVAWSIMAGRPARAIELLELGRAVLWNHVLQLRADLGAVTTIRPELARRLEQVRAALDAQYARMTGDGASGPDPDGAAQAQLDRRIELAHQWDELVAQARSDPRLAGFLRAPSYADLRATASDGPVIVINVAKTRSDALIVGPDQPIVVPLSVTAAEVEQKAQSTWDELTQGGAGRGLNATLVWLWERVARPVLDRLGLTASPDSDRPTRVWWCPTGAIALLPLHAAQEATGADGVPERVVSSYCPTLGALLAAHRAGGHRWPLRRALVVAMPDAPGQVGLNVDAELAEVIRRSPNPPTLLAHEQCRPDVVMAALASHDWAHLACHGSIDLAQPDQSGLVLAGGEVLTISDIARLSLPDATLAFLSACDTAAGDLQLPDEVVHLAAAFHLAGFAHVLATHWPVLDRDAAEVARQFYEELAAAGPPGLAPAYALHRVVRRFRNRMPEYPIRWAAFSHTGV